jgi:maltose O-acetyltransferase
MINMALGRLYTTTRRQAGALYRFLTHHLPREFVEWWRALLRSIPGETGCYLRARLYGFKCGQRVRVLANVVIYHPRSLVIGNDCDITRGCQLNAGGGIEIGNDVLIGPGTMIWSQNHRYESARVLIRNQDYKRAKVTLGDDVWIGAGSIILPGVHLARGTVVAAGSVVNRSTEPYSVVAGVPAQVIRQRSPEINSAEVMNALAEDELRPVHFELPEEAQGNAWQASGMTKG